MFSWTVNWECLTCNAKGNVVVPTDNNEDTGGKTWLRKAYNLIVIAHGLRAVKSKCNSDTFTLAKDYPTLTITREDLKP